MENEESKGDQSQEYADSRVVKTVRSLRRDSAKKSAKGARGVPQATPPVAPQNGTNSIRITKNR